MCAQDKDPLKQENTRKNRPIVVEITITAENEIKYPKNRDRAMEQLLRIMVNNPQVIRALEDQFNAKNIDVKYTFNN